MKKVKVDPSKRILLDVEASSLRKKQRLAEKSNTDRCVRVGNLDVSKLILKPHEHDVLCGRGNFANYHEGNSRFRELVKNYKIDYVSCAKSKKKGFSQLIYDKTRGLDPPGRFLKYEAHLNIWKDIGEKRALEKTRQALREGAPDLVKVLSPDVRAAELMLDLKRITKSSSKDEDRAGSEPSDQTKPADEITESQCSERKSDSSAKKPNDSKEFKGSDGSYCQPNVALRNDNTSIVPENQNETDFSHNNSLTTQENFDECSEHVFATPDLTISENIDDNNMGQESFECPKRSLPAPPRYSYDVIGENPNIPLGLRVGNGNYRQPNLELFANNASIGQDSRSGPGNLNTNFLPMHRHLEAYRERLFATPDIPVSANYASELGARATFSRPDALNDNFQVHGFPRGLREKNQKPNDGKMQITNIFAKAAVAGPKIVPTRYF